MTTANVRKTKTLKWLVIKVLIFDIFKLIISNKLNDELFWSYTRRQHGEVYIYGKWAVLQHSISSKDKSFIGLRF